MNIFSAAYDSLSPANLDNFTNSLRLPGDAGVMGILEASDALLRVTTGTESVGVLPGKESEVSAYRIERDGKTYVNPTIRARSGASFSAELANGLDEETTIHWHGQHVEWRMAGHPLLPVGPGTAYRYAYPVRENKVILSCEFSGVDIAYLDTQRDLGVIIEIASGMPGDGEHPDANRTP